MLNETSYINCVFMTALIMSGKYEEDMFVSGLASCQSFDRHKPQIHSLHILLNHY